MASINYTFNNEQKENKNDVCKSQSIKINLTI